MRTHWFIQMSLLKSTLRCRLLVNALGSKATIAIIVWEFCQMCLWNCADNFIPHQEGLTLLRNNWHVACGYVKTNMKAILTFSTILARIMFPNLHGNIFVEFYLLLVIFPSSLVCFNFARVIPSVILEIDVFEINFHWLKSLTWLVVNGITVVFVVTLYLNLNTSQFCTSHVTQQC